MANTNKLKTLVEPYVRAWLATKHDIEIKDHEKEMLLVTGGLHRFDIVSTDGSVVAGIKTSALRDKTSKGVVGTGVIKSTFTELYFLSLVKAKKKYMILTDKGFYEYFIEYSIGKVATGIEIIHCPLSEEIYARIKDVHERCRNEIGKK